MTVIDLRAKRRRIQTAEWLSAITRINPEIQIAIWSTQAQGVA